MYNLKGEIKKANMDILKNDYKNIVKYNQEELLFTIKKSEYDYLKEFETKIKDNKAILVEIGYNGRSRVIYTEHPDKELKDAIDHQNRVIKDLKDENFELAVKRNSIKTMSIREFIKYRKSNK